MLSLDSKTIVFISVLQAPVIAMVLLLLRRNYPASVKGLGWWAHGTLWIFLGIMLIGARGSVPDILSIPVGTTLLMFGHVIWIMGTERFLGLPSIANRLRLFVAAVCLLFYGFYAFWPVFEARAVLLGLGMFTLCTVHSRRIALGSDSKFAGRMLVFCLLANACVWMARVIGILSGHLDQNLFTSSPFNTALNTTQSVLVLLILFGFVFLASERVRDEFEKLATKDSLTGAMMRRAWDMQAQAEVDRSRRHARPLSLIAMDLDHFKQINDSMGHAAGDQALVDFVNRVAGLLRKQDLLGRIGGEEFVLLLPETAMDEALVVAERIRSVTERESKSPHYTVSIGVADLQLQEGTVASILSRADAAMYRAKSWGRNRVEQA